MLPIDAARRNPFAPGLFADQVVLVTGGGSGIGLVTAKEALQLGAKVAICGRKADKLETAKAELVGSAPGGEADVLALPCDIREAQAVADFVGAVLAKFGRVDVLVNNAGGQFPSPAAQISPRGWEAVIRNNLNGTFFMTREVASRSMIERRSGAIVNVIANIARGFPGMAHTGAARAGVENMTKSLAIEWAMYDVRVNAVAPGIIRSSGTQQYGEELVSMSIQRTPQKRAGTVEEVAHSILYLASPAAAFITGTTLCIDGGASLWGELWQIPDRTDGLR
jgi:citronellol/citronellal dehydrogenase